MGNIEFHLEDCIIPDLNPEFLRLWIKGVVKHHDVALGELTYIFCSDDYILNVNNQYLGHDYYTDIITFKYPTRHILF